MTKPDRFRLTALCSSLVATIALANAAAATFGLAHIGAGLVAPWGTFFAGLAFVLRDRIHRFGLRWVFLAIALGAGVSAGLGLLYGSPIPGLSAVRIALASGAAFVLSELLDTAVYSPLKDRRPALAMLLSNTAGALLDTWVFLWWSGFGVTAGAMAGQVVVKALLVSVPAVVLLRWVDRRAVVRCAT